MSEKINVAPKWDTTKNIENLTINPGYIYAFQDVLLYYINSVIPNPEDVGPIIRKCGDVISGKIPLEDAKFEWYEQHIYNSPNQNNTTTLGQTDLVEKLEKKITDDVNNQST